jgi:hypothetical protein
MIDKTKGKNVFLFIKNKPNSSCIDVAIGLNINDNEAERSVRRLVSKKFLHKTGSERVPGQRYSRGLYSVTRSGDLNINSLV